MSIVVVERRYASRSKVLFDPASRDRMYLMAAAGVSRHGVAMQEGVSSSATITGWITRGLAKPEEPPWNEFAIKYQQAERMHELMGAQVQHQTLQAIRRKRPIERTMAEIAWVDRHMARRFPREHGHGEGLAQMRQLTPDVDLEGWWQEQGLEQEQLQALLREPPESLRAALLAEGDRIVEMLRAGGWRPPRRVAVVKPA